MKSYYITWQQFYQDNCAVSLYHAKNYEYTVSNNPQGYLDSVTGGINSITLRGWAFDADALSENLAIHVYVGSEAGPGVKGYEIIADKHRPDVEQVYSNVGSYHGFQETIAVRKTGMQKIYVYAINTGDGENVLIGTLIEEKVILL